MALADRKGLRHTDMACSVAAATAIGVFKLTTQAWLIRNDAEPDI